MKKLIIGLGILLICISCHKKNNSIGEQETTKPLIGDMNPERISLNGIPFDVANKMVQNFKKAVGSYNKKTTFWFSKKYVDSLDTLLHRENADGLRIYLARRDHELKNTIILVSTTNDGPDTSGKPIHLDYFKHSSKFLHSNDAIVNDEDGNDGGGAWLFKAGICPTKDGCNVTGLNYISCDSAAKWANNYSKDSIKTKSEWFDIKVIDYLNQELHSSTKSDGIRFYLTQSTNDHSQRVVLITTEKLGTVHKDYYECHVDAPIWVTDNGELCPNHCSGTTLPAPNP